MNTFGYVPLHPSLRPPGDRRRFPGYALDRRLNFSVTKDWKGLDVAVLSSETDLVRWCRAPSDVVVVLDLPDAFLDETSSTKTRLRGLAKWIVGPLSYPVMDYDHAMRRLIDRADAVVCSTPEQAEKLERFSDNVHVVLDLHREIEPMPPRKELDDQKGSSRFEVIWEGMHPTLVAIEQVLPALHAINQMTEVVLHLVTDRFASRYMNRFFVRDVSEMVASWGLAVEVHDWQVEVLRDVARNSDLAIVPVVEEDPYTFGKPENRMRIFWRLGLPVIASDTPAHRRAVELAGAPTDTLCRGTEDWKSTIGAYASSVLARKFAADTGYSAALGSYGDKTVLQSWDRVFESVGVR